MHEHARVGSTSLLNFAMARPLTFTLKPHCSGVSGMETSSDMLREKARPEMLSDFLRGPSKMFHVVVFWIQFLGFVGAWINMLNDSYMILPYVSSSRTFWHLSRAQFFKDEAVTAGGP